MLKETKWTSVTNLLRAQQIKTMMTILEKKTCSLCSELLEISNEERRKKQEAHELRRKELRIAWDPGKNRTKRGSSLIQMVNTYNVCRMFDQKLPKTKKSRAKVIKREVLQRFGMSHKP